MGRPFTITDHRRIQQSCKMGNINACSRCTLVTQDDLCIEAVSERHQLARCTKRAQHPNDTEDPASAPKRLKAKVPRTLRCPKTAVTEIHSGGDGIEGLFLGSESAAVQLLSSQAQGKTDEDVIHVLNVCERFVYCPTEASNLHFDRVPIDDHGRTNLFSGSWGLFGKDKRSVFERCAAFITAGLAKGKVLVHCMVGVNRSEIIIVAYLMLVKHWGFSHAYEFVSSCTNIDVHPEYCRQVQEYFRSRCEDTLTI